MLIRLATYNVRNLFLCGEGEEKPAREVRALVKTIGQLNVDVMMLQEVGSLQSLQILNQKLSKPYPFEASVVGNSERSIHLGVLSRVPFETSSHRHIALVDENKMPVQYFANAHAALNAETSPVVVQRDFLKVSLANLTLIGVHLKSKGNPSWQRIGADEIRMLEARALAALAASERAKERHRALVVLGDFNDVAASVSLQPLADLGWFDLHEKHYKALGRNPSTYWPKRRMRIDRMLITPETEGYVVANSAQILIDERFRLASDHYPVAMDLDLPG
ncbi:MAG: endonuclease/exonuclease/phosphatase family metal-dependent hydrolase [Limisphaerales bacterium]